MRKTMILASLVALYCGIAYALPIADSRANITINFPLVIPTQMFVTNRSREQVFTDVARIMKEANKPFRYGKRSAPALMSSGSILDYPPRNFRDDSVAYTRVSAPVFDALLYRTPYQVPNRVDSSNRAKGDIFASFSFPGSFPHYLEALMFRERVRQMDRLFKWKEPDQEAPVNTYKASAKAKLEKLRQMVAVMENTKNKKPLHLINTFYRTSTLTRARPGKRDVSLTEEQALPIEFNGPAVFSAPMGKTTADASTGQTTVEPKNYGGGNGFLRRPWANGYN